VTPILLVVLAFQSPAADTLRELALRLPQSALVAETRARPAVAREAVTFALARRDLVVAGTLSAAYAIAWSDSFLVREVARFAAWPPERQAGKVWVDSVRRAGITVYGRDGAMAAVAVWRRALARALAISDTAAIASVLGNIGAAFSTAGQPDSAESYLERARTLADAIGDVRVAANAIGTLASVRADRGDIGRARDGYAQALGLRARIGDTRGIAADHNNLGLLAETAGDVAEARRQFEVALAVNRREGRDDIAATNLVNLAGLASLDGDFARAATLYHDALATWRAREQWADAADALHGLGQLDVRRGDYPAARAALGEALAIYDRTGPLHSALAARRALSGALAAQGELQGAFDELRRAQRLADSARVAPGVRAGIALARADLAVQLNTLAEAERLYSHAALLFRQAGEPEGLAAAQHGRGALLLEKGDYTRAQTLLDGALRSQLASGQERAAALTRLSLGELAAERGDTGAARRQLSRAAADLTRLGDPVAAAAAIGERAALEATAGLPAAAESLYRAALGEMASRVAPEVTWRLHAGLALVRRNSGATDDAARELRTAIADIERAGQSLRVVERRSGFLADKWDVYAQLALTERTRSRPGAAFEASERLRAREMLEILTRGRVAPADTAAELITREQDLRRRIAELTAGLEGGTSATEALRGPDVAGVGGATREALLREQAAYADLLLEIREQAPRHAALLSPPVVSWRAVAARLSPDEALVEYLVSDSGAVAFVITRDTLAVVDLGASRRDLSRLAQFARGTVERRSPQLDSLWRGPLRGLNQFLIAPLEEAGLLAGKTRLVLVPHAELHYLPFAALVDDRGRFLIERYEIVETPSAAVWLVLGDRRPGRAGIGVLALAPRPDALPASRQEVAAIGRLAGANARVLTGNDASEEVFRRHAPTSRVLHLATYGILNKRNPLFSYVDLAPGGERDGRLEVHEVFGLTLAADLVVLSACQTGLGSGALADVPAGDDWVGLSRAFLSAGAAHVVATLWPVQDRATADLMERFYERFTAGADATASLAAAQRTLLGAPATAHPFYWAGFVSVGGHR
jgi:CHAT domain-containing protein/tetratricopeptide (TPR) repeat protein